MCPSDMTLTELSVHISGYNNEILVDTKGMSPGQNKAPNVEKLPPQPIAPVDRPSVTGSAPPERESKHEHSSGQHSEATLGHDASTDHEDTKTLITVAAIGAGVVYYLWR